MSTISKHLVKMLMNAWPSSPRKNDFSLWEIFCQKEFTQASTVEKDQIKLESSLFRYEYETKNSFFEKYFPDINFDEFHGKKVLDVGCFTGGRLIQWVEKYGFQEGHGIDVNPVFEEAGNLFASKKKVNAHFLTGVAENLPYENNSFDFVVSSDVFEHVRNIEKVMEECFRVLKPGGKLLVVFPPFFQPLEAHLGLVTKMPALHWFFSGQTITTAYTEILDSRGEEAYWYSRKDDSLEEWEKLPSLNGTTVRKFRAIISSNRGWNLISWNKDPILSDGRKSDMAIFRILRVLFVLPAQLPMLEELFLGRICCSLEKSESLALKNDLEK